MNAESFYSDLPVREGFSGIADLSRFTEMPDDWHVVIADVQGSTVAIRRGEYKAVNIVGVSVLTSILNAAKPVSIPYIFGGDGASLCVPQRLVPQARAALIATRRMAGQQFGLGLRIGIVPVSTIRAAGHRLLVSRQRISEYYIQAAFAGDGLEYAEALIKDDADGTPYRINAVDAGMDADYTGLECRWANLPSRHGETISLIVKVSADSLDTAARIYTEIIDTIHRIYGDGAESCPMSADIMQTTLNPRMLKYEFLTRTFHCSDLRCAIYWLFMRMQILMGKLIMKYRLKLGGVDWGRYKTDAVRNADYRKFDGVLREVLSGMAAQRKELTAYLEERYRKGECVYGIHVSTAALITCLINNRSGSHFHFIDGADGGYAMAAAKMKAQVNIDRA
jgi:hypothetical protein